MATQRQPLARLLLAVLMGLGWYAVMVFGVSVLRDVAGALNLFWHEPAFMAIAFPSFVSPAACFQGTYVGWDVTVPGRGARVCGSVGGGLLGGLMSVAACYLWTLLMV